VRISLAKPLPSGESVVLAVGGQEHFGVVVNAKEGPRGGLNGLEFETALSHEEVLAIRRWSETFRDEQRRAFRREVQAWVSGLV